jgi:hypothetical protein
MIQRIQTIFLSLGLLMIALLILIPIGEVSVNEKIYSFSLKGIVDSLSGQTIQPTWYLIVYSLIIILLQLVIIFSFKKRTLQIKLSIVNMILMLGFMITGWLFIKITSKSMGDGIYSFHFVAFFPLVSIFLNYLAYNAIKRDDTLVKSVDRIR